MSEPETILIAQAVGGDSEALAALLKQYGSQVRKQLTIGTAWQSLLDADDVMQVSYLEAFLQIRKFVGQTSEAFLAWLTQIAENNLRDAVRELGRDKRPPPQKRMGAPSPTDTSVTFFETLGGSTWTASKKMAKQEIQNLLREAVARLPTSYRQVVELYDLAGQPAQQVAQTITRSVGAVYMLRARAHDQLRAILGTSSQFFSR